MTNQIKRIVNVENGEILEIELTEDEIVANQKIKNYEDLQLKKIKDDQKVKLGILAKLGITDDEAKLLLS